MKKLYFFSLLILSSGVAMCQTAGEGSLGTDTAYRFPTHRRWNASRKGDSLTNGHNPSFWGDRSSEMNNHHPRGSRYRDDRRDFGPDVSHFRRDDLSFGPDEYRMRGWHLSADQRKRAANINMDFHQKSRELYKKDELTLGQYKAQLLTLQKERKRQIDALLTPEQKEHLSQEKKRREENTQVRAAAQLERMKIRLKLTDEQTAKIKAQQENLRLQIQRIRENSDLLPNQKREQINSIASRRREELKSVLTPEQLSSFENRHKHQTDTK